MSFYNLINGTNIASILVAPLVVGNPYENVARFRDCFIEEGTNDIVILTRLGGGNREHYESDIDSLRSLPDYIRDEDCSDDNTYAYFHFSIPKEFKLDIDLIIANQFKKTSS